MLSFTDQFLAARRVGVPLIGIESNDPGANELLAGLAEVMGGDYKVEKRKDVKGQVHSHAHGGHAHTHDHLHQ